MIPHGIELMHGTVKVQKQDLDGNPIGCQSDNPILDTWLYYVKFPDGEVTPLTANAIVQAMLSVMLTGTSTYYSSASLTYRRTIQL